MNILIFCSNAVNGGTARMFYEMVEAMKAEVNCHRVIACVDKENTVEIYEKVNGLLRVDAYTEEYVCNSMYGGNPVARVIKRVGRKLKYSSVIRRNIEAMRVLLKRENIDAILIHNGGYIGDELCNQMLEAAYQEHIQKRIYILNNCTTNHIFCQVRFWPYDVKVSKYATDIVTVSEFTKRTIEDVSHIRGSIKVVHNGLPCRQSKMSVEEKREKIQLAPNAKNVLMIGNFLENKGQLEALKALKEMKEKIGKVHLTLIGNIYDGGYYQKCMQYIKDNNLNENVSIFNGINNASEYVDLYDLMVVPSMFSESFGLISVEAMMVGVPVVAYDCGGIPEVVRDGRDGYIVRKGDYITMAERVAELLNDDRKRRRMSLQCRRDYEDKFSIGAMMKNYYEIIGL